MLSQAGIPRKTESVSNYLKAHDIMVRKVSENWGLVGGCQCQLKTLVAKKLSSNHVTSSQVHHFVCEMERLDLVGIF